MNSIFDGESKEVSIMFCDIRNFTSISSHLNAKEVVAFLNGFYSLFSQSIIRHNGSVNKYIGDEILAVFGAPVSHVNNHLNAVVCAMEMVDKMAELNEQFKHIVGQEVKIGIGINTGEVVVGNMGSEQKVEYSVAGDTVNVGKRIEALTKDFPNCILISEKTYEACKHAILAKPWELAKVKGKEEEIQVYEVVGRI
jgi:class 3 adenylate cyclase